MFRIGKAPYINVITRCNCKIIRSPSLCVFRDRLFFLSLSSFQHKINTFSHNSQRRRQMAASGRSVGLFHLFISPLAFPFFLHHFILILIFIQMWVSHSVALALPCKSNYILDSSMRFCRKMSAGVCVHAIRDNSDANYLLIFKWASNQLAHITRACILCDPLGAHKTISTTGTLRRQALVII